MTAEQEGSARGSMTVSSGIMNTDPDCLPEEHATVSSRSILCREHIAHEEACSGPWIACLPMQRLMSREGLVALLFYPTDSLNYWS